MESQKQAFSKKIIFLIGLFVLVIVGILSYSVWKENKKSAVKHISTETKKVRVELMQHMKRKDERIILDAGWSEAHDGKLVLNTSVSDNGNNRDSIAKYVCMVVKSNFHSSFGESNEMFIYVKDEKGSKTLGKFVCRR